VTQIVQKSYNYKEVAQKSSSDSRAHCGVVVLHAEEVTGCGGYVTAGSQCYATHKVETDPQTPRVVVIEVGYSADTFIETQEGKNQTTSKNDSGKDVSGVPEVFLIVTHYASPSGLELSSTSSLSGF
jgi:hypothetical protein